MPDILHQSTCLIFMAQSYKGQAWKNVSDVNRRVVDDKDVDINYQVEGHGNDTRSLGHRVSEVCGDGSPWLTSEARNGKLDGICRVRDMRVLCKVGVPDPLKLGPHERIRSQKGSPACIRILEKLLALSRPGRKDKVIVVQPRASMTPEWAVQQKFREA